MEYSSSADDKWIINEFVLYEPVVRPLKFDTYRRDGMYYIMIADFAVMIDCPANKVKRIAKKLIAQGKLSDQDIRELPYVTEDGDILKLPGYSLNAVEIVSERLKRNCQQYLLWAHGRLDQSRQHEYDDLILNLKKQEEAIVSKYRYNILDYFWYVGEAEKPGWLYHDGAMFLTIITWLLSIPLYFKFLSFINKWLYLVTIVAIVEIFCHLRYTPERKQATIAHFSTRKIPVDVVLILTYIGLLLFLLVTIFVIHNSR